MPPAENRPRRRSSSPTVLCTRCQDFIEYKHAIPAHALTYMSKRNSGGCLGIGRPQGPPKGPENGPRGPPHGPSGSQNGPKRPQEDGPKRDPIGPQGSPKRALRRPNKESPKRAPRDLSPRGPCECHDSRLVIVLFAAWPCRRHDLKLAPRAGTLEPRAFSADGSLACLVDHTVLSLPKASSSTLSSCASFGL